MSPLCASRRSVRNSEGLSTPSRHLGRIPLRGRPRKSSDGDVAGQIGDIGEDPLRFLAVANVESEDLR
jgi:hypothetical protein